MIINNFKILSNIFFKLFGKKYFLKNRLAHISNIELLLSNKNKIEYRSDSDVVIYGKTKNKLVVMLGYLIVYPNYPFKDSENYKLNNRIIQFIPGENNSIRLWELTMMGCTGIQFIPKI